MKCDSKTMIKIAVGLGAALAIAYVAWPAAQTFILASAPFLLALSCPLAMIFMMKGMNSERKDARAEPGEGEVKPAAGAAGPDGTR